MTTAYALAAARARATATMTTRRPLLVGLVVLDENGLDVEVVAPFGSETAARQWATLEGVTSFRLLPARIAGGRR